MMTILRFSILSFILVMIAIDGGSTSFWLVHALVVLPNRNNNHPIPTVSSLSFHSISQCNPKRKLSTSFLRHRQTKRPNSQTTTTILENRHQFEVLSMVSNENSIINKEYANNHNTYNHNNNHNDDDNNTNSSEKKQLHGAKCKSIGR